MNNLTSKSFRFLATALGLSLCLLAGHAMAVHNIVTQMGHNQLVASELGITTSMGHDPGGTSTADLAFTGGNAAVF